MMMQKITKYIEDNRLIEYGDRIVIGVSGGADSVCLFRVLLAVKERYGLSLFVVHIEHGIRGKDSLDDAKFVEKLCKKYGILYCGYSFDVVGMAKKQGLTVEEMGRKVRYETFEETSKQLNANKLAVAHHMNDQAETVLFHMVRGSAVRGISGIPVKRGKVIRPLLCVTRKEIEQYLKEIGQEYRIDETNEDTAYTRNYVRHEILPRLENVNAQAVRHISQMTEYAAFMQQLFDEKTDEWEQKARSGNKLLLDALFECPVMIKKEMIYRMIARKCGGKKDITNSHVESVYALTGLSVGSKISLPKGVTAYRDYDGIVIEKEKTDEKRAHTEKEQEIFIHPGEKTAVCYLGMEYLFWIENIYGDNVKEYIENDKKSYTKCFDYDRINEIPVLRTRRAGDYITVDSAGSRQKLKNYFINEKIPRSVRDEVTLFADGSHIIWAVGQRIGEAYKVTPQTKQVLCVCCRKVGESTKGSNLR